MNNVISISAVREKKKIEQGDLEYQKLVSSMDKVELLEEMMRFQEERSREGELTLPLMIRGRILFKTLERNAETQELRDLAKSYRRHLKLELEHYQCHSG